VSTPSCFVCSSKQCFPSLTIQTPAGKVPYFRCSECSLIFQDPTSFDETKIYNADYILKRSQDPDDIHIAGPEKKLQNITTVGLKIGTKGNLLEVGCATGIALKVAQNHEWNVFGVEVNEQAANIARNF